MGTLSFSCFAGGCANFYERSYITILLHIMMRVRGYDEPQAGRRALPYEFVRARITRGTRVGTGPGLPVCRGCTDYLQVYNY